MESEIGGATATPRGRLPRLLARSLFYVALPLALVLTNVRFAFSEQRVYQYSIDQYDVAGVTHIPHTDLIAATNDLRAYFTNDEQYLRTRVHDPAGNVVPLFNAKEVSHMHDVKQVVRVVYGLELLAVGVLAAYVVGAVLWAQEESLLTLARRARRGALATVVALLAFGGVTAAGGFDSAFIWFHQRVFNNNDWQLDPLRDHLVQMFPEGFWLDATVLISALTLLEVALIGGVATLCLRRHGAPQQSAAAPTAAREDEERQPEVAQTVG